MPKKAKDPRPPPEFPHSLHKRGGWRAQWKRVCRWQVRVKSCDGYDREDFLYVFFQNCASLRDWLRYDRPQSLKQSDLEDLVKNHVELRICQDISNAMKHLQLSEPKMPREFAQAREYVPAPLAGGLPSTSVILLVSGSKYDAIALADRCVDIWQTFLSSHGLA